MPYRKRYSKVEPEELREEALVSCYRALLQTDFSCLFLFMGPTEVEDAMLAIEQGLSEKSATCDLTASVFGGVSKVAARIKLSIDR